MANGCACGVTRYQIFEFAIRVQWIALSTRSITEAVFR
jgi:hypothetical protein